VSLAQELAHGRVYRRLRVHQSRRARARDAIAVMREKAPRSYLSLSWGKQSLIVAHMLYVLDPTIPSYFLASSESWGLHNFADVIAAFCDRWPLKHTIVQTDRWADAPSWQAARLSGRGDLQAVADRDGPWDGWYGGLAREESRTRRIALSMRSDSGHPDVYHYVDGTYRCSPLAAWELPDLAAYIDEFDLPLLAAYHRGGLAVRTTARITGRMLTQGGASTAGDVSAWNALLAQFPELAIWR